MLPLEKLYFQNIVFSPNSHHLAKKSFSTSNISPTFAPTKRTFIKRQFIHGFAAGAISSLSGTMIRGAEKGSITEALGGGSFANGAITGAYVVLFNHLGNHQEPQKPQEPQNIKTTVNVKSNNREVTGTGTLVVEIGVEFDKDGNYNNFTYDIEMKDPIGMLAFERNDKGIRSYYYDGKIEIYVKGAITGSIPIGNYLPYYVELARFPAMVHVTYNVNSGAFENYYYLDETTGVGYNLLPEN